MKKINIMSKIVGKIKITEDRIITTKNNIVETWTRWGNGHEGIFIVYKNNRYKLLKSKETDVELDLDDEE
jgi:hypothetical protein